MNRSASPWMAFLVLVFAVVGMTGMIASSIAPLPLERALARDTTLDEALAAAGAPDEHARLEALRPRLDDSAGAVLAAAPALPQRIATERAAMHARFTAEAAADGTHLLWMIGVVTTMGAVFGVATLAFSGKASDQNRRNPEVEVSNIREM